MKRKILVVCATMLLSATWVSAEMVGFWRLCEGTGDTVFDYSERCVDAKIPSQSAEWVSGVFGGALQLRPSSQYIHLKNAAVSFDRTDKFSLALWLKIPNSASNSCFVLRKSSELAGYQLAVTSGNVWINFKTSAQHSIGIRGSINIFDDVWHHVVMTYDGSSRASGMKLFMDGNPDNNIRIVSDNLEENSFKNDADLCLGDFSKTISFEDVGIFNHELSLEEIRELYKGNICAFLMPFGQKVIAAGKQADALIAGKKFNDAIALLESNIKEYELWSESKGGKVGLGNETAISNLYYLLAQAKSLTNAPKQEIAGIQQKILSLRGADHSIYGSALDWFLENESLQTYEQIIHAAIDNKIDCIAPMVANANLLVDEKKADIAVKFLETGWDICGNYGQFQNKSPLFYNTLAKAKQATGCPQKELAAFYGKALNGVHSGYQLQQVSALKWLLDNEFTGECKEFVRSTGTNDNTTNAFRAIIAELSMQYQAAKDIIPFERFLNVVCTEASDPYATLSWLADGNSRWANACSEYLKSQPKYIIARYMTDDQFKKASEYCAELIKLNRVGGQEIYIDFTICKCAFMCGDYEKAITQLDKFIAEHKNETRTLLQKAILMKARSYIQLGHADKAIDCLVKMIAEYPEAKDMAETSFFVGYCYMLQGKNKEARETFSNVISDFKNSPYANKARICLTRIEEKSA